MARRRFDFALVHELSFRGDRRAGVTLEWVHLEAHHIDTVPARHLYIECMERRGTGARIYLGFDGRDVKLGE
ncbi:MAG: hypothetical protein P8Y11_08335 [Gemmatimonadales bacterium]